MKKTSKETLAVFTGMTVTTSKNINGLPYQHNFVALGVPSKDSIEGDSVTLDDEKYILLGINFYEGLCNSVIIKVDYLCISTWCHCSEWCTIPGIACDSKIYQDVITSFSKGFDDLKENGYDQSFEYLMDILMEKTDIVNMCN